jgi:hypothetical protein
VKEINNYIIEDFADKVYAAKKANKQQVVLDIKEAQILVENLTIVLARALSNTEKMVSSNEDGTISVQVDGGSF